MRRRRLRAELDFPEMNLTPLIDVLFVLLIAFIVIAPLLDVDKIQLPTSRKGVKTIQQLEQTSPLAIRVRDDNSIWVGGRQVAPGNLADLFAKARTTHPTAKPQLMHDERARFGTYQQIKGALEAAGFEEMDVVLSPP